MSYHLAATVVVTTLTLFSCSGRECDIRPIDSSSSQLKYQSRRDFYRGCVCVWKCLLNASQKYCTRVNGRTGRADYWQVNYHVMLTWRAVYGFVALIYFMRWTRFSVVGFIGNAVDNNKGYRYAFNRLRVYMKWIVVTFFRVPNLYPNCIGKLIFIFFIFLKTN